MRVKEFTEADHSAVTSAARILRSRYRDYCEYEDIQQELYLYLIKKYESVLFWREAYSEDHSHRMVVKMLRNFGEKWCRDQKADLVGYEPEDEFFYTIPMVQDMLQLYFDPDWMMPPALEPVQGSGGKPPEEGFNLPAMVADVGKAYERLPQGDRELIHRVFGGDLPVRDAIAVEALNWEVTQGAADRRIRRVCGRIRSQLGGPRPYPEGRDDL